LTTLLAETGANAAGFAPGSLSYTLGGSVAGDNTVLIQKSDGSDWLAVWNESAGAHTVTVTLPGAATQIQVFDPVTGTAALSTANNAASVSFSLSADPLLVRIVPAGGPAGRGPEGRGHAGGPPRGGRPRRRQTGGRTRGMR